MDARTWVVLLVSAALWLAPAGAGAEETGREGDETKSTLSTSYERGRFLLDGGFHGYASPLDVPVYFAWVFLRGRYQVNRYVAVEQTNRLLVPFPGFSDHLVGVRGQIPLPNFWSLFLTARVGLRNDVFGSLGGRGQAGFKDRIVEVGVGAERLAATGVLYGVEWGAARYFGRLSPSVIVPHVRLSVGYAFRQSTRVVGRETSQFYPGSHRFSIKISSRADRSATGIDAEKSVVRAALWMAAVTFLFGGCYSSSDSDGPESWDAGATADSTPDLGFEPSDSGDTADSSPDVGEDSGGETSSRNCSEPGEECPAGEGCYEVPWKPEPDCHEPCDGQSECSSNLECINSTICANPPAILSMDITPEAIQSTETGMTDEYFEIRIEVDGFAEITTVRVFLENRERPRTFSEGEFSVSDGTIRVTELPYSWLNGLEPGTYRVGAKITDREMASRSNRGLARIAIAE